MKMLLASNDRDQSVNDVIGDWNQILGDSEKFVIKFEFSMKQKYFKMFPIKIDFFCL